MKLELTDEDGRALQEMLQQRIVELDREINRTDSLAFKHELRLVDRTMERILGEVSAALRETR
jgi:hypothetical protein